MPVSASWDGVNVPTACPACNGPLWDNRVSKRNPKMPDFKCRNRTCDTPIWPPKGQRAAPAAPAPQAKQEFNHPPAGSMPFDAPDTEKLDRLFALHDACLAHALSQATTLEKHGIGDSPEAVSARAAALMIQASK